MGNNLKAVKNMGVIVFFSWFAIEGVDKWSSGPLFVVSFGDRPMFSSGHIGTC